mgnify:CR=1 FL=1
MHMYYTIILYLSLQLSFPSLLTSTNKESTDFLYQIKTLSQLVKTQKQLVKTSRQFNVSQLVKATSKLNNTTAQQAMTSSEVDEFEGNTDSVVPQNISQNRRKAISSSITALAIIVVALLPKFLLIYNAKKNQKVAIQQIIFRMKKIICMILNTSKVISMPKIMNTSKIISIFMIITISTILTTKTTM